MVTYEKELSPYRLAYYDELKFECERQYQDVIFVKNFYLTCEKIYKSLSENVNVVECGVFNGGTLMCATCKTG